MSGNVEIVIGAKDQASAVLQKVAAETAKVGTSVKSMADRSGRSTAAMSSAFASLKSAIGPLIGAFAAFKSAQALTGFLSSSTAAFNEDAEAARGLAKAIELSGNSLGPSIDQHKAFATEMQKIANVGDEVTIGLMKQAATLGVSNQELQEVTRAAIGLSEATGQDLETSLRAVQNAMAGNFTALQRSIPILRTLQTDEEKLAFIQKLAGDGLIQKAERAKTAQGAAERLANSWGDFKEIVGAALQPINMLVSTGLAVLVETIQTAVIPAINALMPSTEAVSQAMQRMKIGVIAAVTMMEVVIGNLGNIWQIAVLSIALQMTRIAETVRHYFSVSLTFVSWYARNFVTLLTDGFRLAQTVIVNFATMAHDVLSTMWTFIASRGEKGAVEFVTALAKGSAMNFAETFKAESEPLPEIIGMQVSEAQSSLMAQINGLSGDIAGEFQKKMQERMTASGQAAGDSLLAGINLSAGAAGNTVDDIGKKIRSESQILQATQSRLLARGPGSNPVLEETRKVTQGIGVLTKITEIIAKNTEQKQKPGLDLVEVGLA